MENPPLLMAPGHLAEPRVEVEEEQTSLTRTRATVAGREEEVLQERTNTRVSTKIACLKTNAVNVWADITHRAASDIRSSIIRHVTFVKITDWNFFIRRRCAVLRSRDT